MTSPGSTPALAAVSLPSPDRGFVSLRPGETWEEGLLTGNGTIGANMFSQPLNETIIFTHERLFLPSGDPLMPPDNGMRLFEIRRLIDRGLYRQAAQLAADFSGQDGFMYPDPFVPAFDLRLMMGEKQRVRDYSRSVDFQTGVATVRWTDDRGTFTRRLFVSRADKLAVLAISATKPGTLDCRLELTPRRPSIKLGEKTVRASHEKFQTHVGDVAATADESSLAYRMTFSKAYSGSIQSLEGVAQVRCQGGTQSADGRAMTIQGADEVLVLIALDLLYKKDVSRLDETKQRLASMTENFDTLLGKHARLHGELFNRMRIDLGGGPQRRMPSEPLIAKSTMDAPSAALIEKQFDAGRYNIICSTGELPPTLQGIWGGTYVPSWASDFTHNGNVPSAIAATLMGNTPELMLAYTSYIESIVPYLQINARHMFGARGVVLPSRSTTNGFNNAVAPTFTGGFWVAGAAWASHFFYDYYLYTGDRQFLAEHALPFMEQSALFFEDYLYEGPDGKYVFNPTQSPENTPGNTRSQATFNATMDVMAAKELLRNTIAASRTLGVNQEKIAVWQAMLEKMPAYMIDKKEGVIKEWLTPKLEENLDHRHSSQLYALYDGISPEIAGSAELQAACKRLIAIKLDRHYSHSGFMSFGVVQLGQAAASLGEGELAYACLKHLVNRFWLSNLASMHNHRSLLNMDISGGQPAVMIKMLVASHVDGEPGSEPVRVELLPALPAAWPSGKLEGALCRGQIKVRELDWNPEGAEVRLVSKKQQTIVLSAPWEIREAAVTSGAASLCATGEKDRVRVALPAGTEVSLKLVRKAG